MEQSLAIIMTTTSTAMNISPSMISIVTLRLYQKADSISSMVDTVRDSGISIRRILPHLPSNKKS